MFELPEIKRKQPKAPYRKPDAVKELEKMANDEARMLHPTCPNLAPRTFKDNSANGLTKCIVKYITLRGGFASRVNTTGMYDPRLKMYRRSTQKRGMPDIIATWQGRSLFIEVKYGKDRISIDQMKIAEEQRSSGGKYFVANNFESFKEWFDRL